MPIPARFVRFLSLLLLAILVGGCGGDGDGAGSGASESSDLGGPTGAIDPATGIELRATIKEHVFAIESCAANNTTGAYTGCLDVAALTAFEPTLAQAPGETTVAAGDDPTQSFEVSTTIDASTFTEAHRADGSITKTCEPTGTAICETGTW